MAKARRTPKGVKKVWYEVWYRGDGAVWFHRSGRYRTKEKADALADELRTKLGGDVRVDEVWRL